MEEYERIELRSEKVRNIMGDIPPELVRYGISILFVVLLFLFAIAYIVPYHEVVKAEVVVRTVVKSYDGLRVEILVPYVDITKFTKHHRVDVKLEGYEGQQYNGWNAVVADVDEQVFVMKDRNYFRAVIEMKGHEVPIYVGMKGVISRIVSSKSVWNVLFSK